jgi:hypothetical protein
MRKLLFFAVFTALAAPAAADEFSCSFNAINAYLKTDWEKFLAWEPTAPKDEKTGIVSRYAACPPTEQGGMLEYMDGFQLVPIDEKRDAILIDTHQCGGGNKHGQYFLISANGKCDLIRDPKIGDMSFKGMRWTDSDAHCCPSREGTLEYDVSTGRYKFKLRRIGRK